MVNEKLTLENSDDESSCHSDSDTSEFIKQCDVLLIKINKNYKEQKSEIKNLIKLHKKELKTARRYKKGKQNRDKTGFTKPTIVPDKLSSLIGLERGTIMSRTELTKLIYHELHKRDLYYKNDKRVLRADNEIRKIFNLPESVNQSVDPKDKNGFNFYNLQKYIARCYLDTDNKSNTVVRELRLRA